MLDNRILMAIPPTPGETLSTSEAADAARSGFVTILGRPNVGKSTLVNRMVGQKVAIVTDKPQTTRSRILGIVQLDDAQLVLVDTPGIHKPKYQLNRRMVEVSFAEAGANDVNLVLLSAPDGLGPGDRFVIERAAAAGKTLILGINKVDLVRRDRLLPLIEGVSGTATWSAIVPFSALTGENLDELSRELVRSLPFGPPLFPADAVTDQPEQLLVAELVREKLVELTEQEIPFSTAVTVESWQDRTGPKPMAVIEVVIWVERDSQKGIVVGKGGRLIKEIGQRSRVEIEALLGRGVYLDLRVKVQAAWREDRRFLGRLFPD